MAAIRRSTDDDRQAIRAIHCAAFPTEAEADLVDRLVADGDSVISLIAEEGSDAAGHILLSRMTADLGGQALRALALAPVAVRPDRQGHGIGTRLIGAAIAEARSEGEEVIILLGEPTYYRRFGFSVDCASVFESPYSGPYLQALWLRSPANRTDHGSARHAPAFAALK